MKPRDTSASELGILKLLWRHERLSAREIHEHVGAEQGWAYSTTRTVLDRMAKKGQLRKGSLHGLNVYEPALAKVPTLADMVRDFTGRVFGTRPSSAIPMFAESDLLSEQEIAELEALLEEEDGEGGSK